MPSYMDLLTGFGGVAVLAVILTGACLACVWATFDED